MAVVYLVQERFIFKPEKLKQDFKMVSALMDYTLQLKIRWDWFFIFMATAVA